MGKEGADMETTLQNLMVPLEKYVTVSEAATLKDAVTALEKAQEELDRSSYRHPHRAVLVLNSQNEVVGKISQLDILKGLEPNYKHIVDTTRRISVSGFSANFLTSMMDMHHLWVHPLSDICSKAATIEVKDFMITPTEGEFIDEKASVEEAMHMMVMGHHHSLLVTKGKKIVGVLRLTDVVMHLNDLIKACNT